MEILTAIEAIIYQQPPLRIYLIANKVKQFGTMSEGNFCKLPHYILESNPKKSKKPLRDEKWKPSHTHHPLGNNWGTNNGKLKKT